MPRLLSLVMIFFVSSMCLSNDWTGAQEAKQKCSQCEECQECPAAQTAGPRSWKFESPGVDFPFGIHVEVGFDEHPSGQDSVDASIEINCECEKFLSIPFLSNLPMMGPTFTNVGMPAHCPCGALQARNDSVTAKTNSCQGPCSTCSSDAISNSCKACQQDSECKECDGCPSTSMVKAIQTIGPQGIQIHPQGVQLAGYVETSRDENMDAERFEMREEMFELRLENERLKMEVEAAEERLEMMEAVMEMREENAVLRTRIEFLEAHHDHSVEPAHSRHRAK